MSLSDVKAVPKQLPSAHDSMGLHQNSIFPTHTDSLLITEEGVILKLVHHRLNGQRAMLKNLHDVILSEVGHANGSDQTLSDTLFQTLPYNMSIHRAMEKHSSQSSSE
jgi:hypothetical protein